MSKSKGKTSKCTIVAGKMAGALRLLEAATKRNVGGGLPVLGFVLLSVDGAVARMSATDLEVEMVITVGDAVSSSDRFDIMLPAKKLRDICASFPDADEISMSVSDDGGRAAFSSGRSRFFLATMDAGEYPSMGAGAADGATFSIPGQMVLDMIRCVKGSIGVRDVRYYLNGMFLSLSNGALKAAATDGHRLSVFEASGDFGGGSSEPSGILPSAAVQHIQRVATGAGDGNVSVSLSDRHARFESAGTCVTSKLIDGRYPDYGKVIPAATGMGAVTVSTDGLRSALNQIKILGHTRTNYGARLTIGGGLIRATFLNAEGEEVVAEVACQTCDPDLAAEIGANPMYLLDGLDPIDSDSVTIRAHKTDYDRLPLAISDLGNAGYRNFVMPMRL